MNTNISSGLYVRGEKNLGRRDQRVRRLTKKMRACMPWLEDADLPLCRGWAELEILANRAYAILSSVGLVNKEGQALRLLGDFRLLRQTQLNYANALGMSPASRLALQIAGEDKALDLAQIASEYQNGDAQGEQNAPAAADGAGGAQDAARGAAGAANGIPEGDRQEEE